MPTVVSFQRPVAPLELWIEYCQARGLTPEVLAPIKGELLTIEAASKVVGTGIFGFKHLGAIGAYVFQLSKDEYQARLLYGPEPEIPKVGDHVKPPKRIKYFRPKGSANILFIPPHLTDWYADVRYNLLIVEGALNAVRLAAQGFHAVAITGVHNYRTGSKHTPILAEIIHFAKSVQAERVTVLFDSDTGDPETKKELWNGIHNFCQDLIRLRPDRRDTIYLCRPPQRPDGEKQGPDDFLHTYGLDEFNKLIREQSEKYDDNPYLRLERQYLNRFIYDEVSGQFYDVKIRNLVKSEHADRTMATGGMVDDITATRPSRVLYSTKRLLAAPGLRTAQGRRFQPDVEDIYFLDDTEEPPRYYVNTFQPEDLPKPIKGDVSIAYEVMRSVCRNTPGAVNKILTIIARHAQYPALIPKYGLLLTGEQGSGKSSLARLIGTSLSKKYNEDKVNLRIDFNSEWRGFACKEWPEFDRDMDEEWLKDLITGESYLVSVKYGVNYREKNHTLNIFTCNGLQAKLQHGDRRFVVCGDAKSDNKKLGLEFESWIKGVGPNHFRYHLLNEVDSSGYDLLDTWTELKQAVIEASQSYKSTVKDYILEDLNGVEGLECIPNSVLQALLDPHKVNVISFNKEYGQYFVKPGIDVIKIDGVAHRFRAFKNHEKWRRETKTEAYKEQFKLCTALLKIQKY